MTCRAYVRSCSSNLAITTSSENWLRILLRPASPSADRRSLSFSMRLSMPAPDGLVSPAIGSPSSNPGNAENNPGVLNSAV